MHGEGPAGEQARDALHSQVKFAKPSPSSVRVPSHAAHHPPPCRYQAADKEIDKCDVLYAEIFNVGTHVRRGAEQDLHREKMQVCPCLCFYVVNCVLI